MADCLRRLLGICCPQDCVCKPENPWEERRVVGVAGRTAFTPQGPVRLSTGNNPGVGGVVVVSGGLAAGATPQFRGSLPSPATEPFFVSEVSYDSPQRPGRWGGPATDEDGVFLGPSDQPQQSWPILVFWNDLEQGGSLNFQFAVNHDTREILHRMDTFTGSSGLSVNAAPLPWRSLIAQQEPTLILPPRTVGDYGRDQAVVWYSPAPADLTSRAGGSTTRTVTEAVLRFDGTSESRVIGAVSSSGTVYMGKMTIWYRTAAEEAFSARPAYGYRVETEWRRNGGAIGSQDYLATRYIRVQVGILVMSRGQQEERWITLDDGLRYYTNHDKAIEEGWIADGKTYRYVDLLEDVQGSTPPAPEPPPLRFSAAGGSVTVTGPRNGNPANLNSDIDVLEATLNAWGHSFVGGSWAAIRAHPVLRRDGTLDMGGVIALHEQGGTVTAVRPDGVETCSRERFEREVLRCEPGVFRHFTDAGALFTDWPHPWALADCTTHARAVVAHEPWRDSIKKAKDPLTPASWVWPGRPPRRFVTPPPLAPRPPLGLTLADVLPGSYTLPEPLAYREPPLVLPSRVDVWEGGVWVESGRALAALRKTVLYQPSGWTEELNDRTSVKGRLRVHYPFVVPKKNPEGIPVMTGTLLIRAQRPRVGNLGVFVRGKGGAEGPPPADILGHNAPEIRGWHPYAVKTGELPPGPVVIELEAGHPVSRALLGIQVEETQDAS